MATTEACFGDSGDKSFGSQVNSFCRPFDFTLYFEDIILEVIPAAVFLFLLPGVFWILLHQKHIVSPSTRLHVKCTLLLIIATLQLAILAMRVQNTALQTSASLVADILTFIAFIGAFFVSFLSHLRSIRPSTVLTLFLSFVVLLNCPRIRTFWLIYQHQDNDVPVSLPTISLLVEVLLLTALFLESLEKRKHVQGAEVCDTPEQYSGFWKRTSFAWLAHTFGQGYSIILSVGDLPSLDPRLKSDLIVEQLQLRWSQCDQKASHSMLRACLRTFWLSLASGAIPRLCLTGFTFAQPFLINTLTTYVGLSHPDVDHGRSLIGASALVYIGMAISSAVYWYQTYRFLIRLRAGLISLVYKQSLQARKVDMPDITAVTLMGTDIERIVVGFRSIHELWASILDIAIALWLLEQQVYAACIMPALIAIIFIGITFKISTIASNQQRRWIERVEKRIKITASMLSDMRAVQMLGLNQKMESVVQGLRQIEIHTSEVFRKILICQVFFSNSPTNLAPMATFVVFAIIAAVKQNETLLTAQAFTAFALISLLTTPVLTFIQAVPSIIQCVGSFNRIQEFCSVPASSSMASADLVTPTSSLQGLASSTNGLANAHDSCTELQLIAPIMLDQFITFVDCDFAWKKGQEAVLKHINLDISMKTFTFIVGPVGSGKSSILACMLGESLQLRGRVSRNEASISYCAQTAWLQNTSIRSNIIGPAEYEEDWYATVVRACALDEDLSAMPDGDQTNVGSSGNNLSGGQRQRVALARAVYTRHKVIIMDDIFSGMDSHTVEHISRRIFSQQGLLRQQGMTVVLVTSTYKLLPLANIIVVLEGGQITGAGNADSIQSNHDFLSQVQVRVQENDENWEETELAADKSKPQIQVIHGPPTDLADRDPSRRNGDFSVYRYYAEASGRRAVISFLSFMLLWAFCGQFPTVWLKLWSDANERAPNQQLGMYVGVYAVLGVSGTFCMTAACWFLFIPIISNSALRLHESLLRTTLRAPLRFFSKTDVGNLTNRFSQDMELIGMDLPLLAINYIAALCSCFVKIIILAVFAEYLGITIPIVAVVIFFLQKFYLRTSRQVRLLDIEAKAPVYSHFLETVDGAVTIRALRWQIQFGDRCHSLLDNSQRPIYILYCIQQWLTFILDLIVAALAVVLVALAVVFKDRFTPGAVGVSLVTVMTFNTTLMSLIKYWTLLETSIGAVSRVKKFVESTECEKNIDSHKELPPDWPAKGVVTFSGVYASHVTPENPVLKDVSISIQAGEKIAICGRSGSGKTSMILSILQMLRVDKGCITIDGIDIASIGCSDLRARLNVVPQEPFLIPGTIRFNLDPFEAVTDEKIMLALEKVGLGKIIRADTDGLDKIMDVAAWSTGQRQLLCLARASIRQSSILILDEATSSLDHDIERIVQDVVGKDFANRTVLSVLHRLRFIQRYDKVLLLDAGQVIEFDSPEALLNRQSVFAEMYRASGHIL